MATMPPNLIGSMTTMPHYAYEGTWAVALCHTMPLKPIVQTKVPQYAYEGT